jgi:phage protein D
LARVERSQAMTLFTAYDMGLKMKLFKRPGYHAKKKDVAILRDLAARNRLRFQGPGTWAADGRPAITQDEQTDWEFALEVARDAGLVLFVRHDTLFALPPAKAGTPALTLANRQDFNLGADWDFTYKTPENQEGRPRKVTRRGRGKGGKRLDGASDASGKEGGRERLVFKRDVPGRHTKGVLSARAKAQKELEREHAFEGHLRVFWPVSNARPDVRDTVRVAGVGKLFGGDYLVDRANYQFGPGQLEMNLALYRDAAI